MKIKGENGLPARGVDITGALSISYNTTTGVYTPANLSLTAQPQNITTPTSYSWSSPNSSATFTPSNAATTTITPTANAYLTGIQVTVGVADSTGNPVSKTITIAVAKDGAPQKGTDINGATTIIFKRNSLTGVYTPANSGVLTANPQNLANASYAWTVSGGSFSSSSTLTTSTSSSVTVYPTDTSSVVVTLQITSEGITYSKSVVYSVVSDVTGKDGRRTATGVVYKTDPAQTADYPTATSYTFSTGVFVGLSSTWSKAAPTFEANNTYKYWTATYTAVEGDTNTTTGTGGSLSFSAPTQTIGFSGLVTFVSATEISGTYNSQPVTVAGFSNQTQINGGQITTGTVDAGKLTIGQSTGPNRILLTNNSIEVYQNYVLRVKIGQL